MRALCIVALLLGCTRAHEPVMDAGPPDTSLDANVDAGREDIALLVAVHRAICARELACTPEARLDADEYGNHCGPWALSEGIHGVLTGEAHVDVSAAQACLDRVERLAACPSYDPRHRVERAGRDALIACNRVLVRDRPICGDEACEVGDYCRLDETCVLHCAGAPGPGDPCTSSTDFCRNGACAGDVCTAGCDWSSCLATGFDSCRSSGCHRTAAVGEPCDASEDCALDALCTASGCALIVHRGDACGALAWCDEQSYCDATGHCADFLAPGEPCTSLDRCGPDARCDGVCVDRPRYGETCTSPTQCAEALDCDWLGTLRCVAVPNRCEHDVRGCGPGMYCTGVPETPCSPEPEGSLCRSQWYYDDDLFSHDSCPAGYQCDVSRRCHRPSEIGSACDATRPCVAGSRCEGGICLATVFPWEPCSERAPCVHGYACVDGACEARITPGHIGGSCRRGDACYDGTCLEGTCAYRPVGAACAYRSECPGCDGSICQSFTSLGRGDTCVMGGECGAGLRCASIAPSTLVCCPSD